MKTRKGFVSNSSSSSFIVALNEGVKPKLKFTVEVDLSRWGRVATTLEELDAAMREEWPYTVGRAPQGADLVVWLTENDEEHLAERYRDMEEVLGEGKTVVVGSIANDTCYPMQTYVYDHGWPESDDYEVILGGY